jgi:hypothetical protein
MKTTDINYKPTKKVGTLTLPTAVQHHQLSLLFQENWILAFYQLIHENMLAFNFDSTVFLKIKVVKEN